MTIRVATFNAMNLFSRARPLAVEDWEEARPVLNDIKELTKLLAKKKYNAETKKLIAEILVRNGLETKTEKDDLFTINQARGKLYKVKKATKKLEVTASGRDRWLGWVDLPRQILDSEAVRNTAMVISEVNADVLAMVEVEDRATLKRFHKDVLLEYGFLDRETSYPHNMLIDGNDDRGIDVGLYSRFPIATVTSHIDDKFTATNNTKWPIFSRDCPEFEVHLPSGEVVWVLVNHLKSKGYGSQASSNKKRERQATQIRNILDDYYDLDSDYVVVAGDFNDTPDSEPLKPLLKKKGLYDVLKELDKADRWTYHSRKQIDYLLVSRALKDKIVEVGIEKRGIYHGTKFGGTVEPFPSVTSKKNQASDHAAIWVDLDL